jgi:hypothetical protein
MGGLPGGVAVGLWSCSLPVGGGSGLFGGTGLNNGSGAYDGGRRNGASADAALVGSFAAGRCKSSPEHPALATNEIATQAIVWMRMVPPGADLSARFLTTAMARSAGR